MKRFLPHVCWLAGVLMTLCGSVLLVFAMTPYTDPDIEMEERLFNEFILSLSLGATGLLSLLTGIAWVVYRRRRPSHPLERPLSV